MVESLHGLYFRPGANTQNWQNIAEIKCKRNKTLNKWSNELSRQLKNINGQ